MGGGGGSVKETEYQKALAQVAAKRYNRYQQAYVGLENQFIRDVQQFRNPDQYRQGRSIAAAATAPAFADARSRIDKSEFGAGVNPNSGRYESSSLAKAHARGLGQNVANAQIDTTNRYFSGLENVVAMGQGQSGSAIMSMADIAKTSGASASSAAKSAYERSQGTAEVFGTAAGLGTGVYMNNNTGGG